VRATSTLNGDSSYSNVASTTTAGPLAAPSNLAATAISTSQINLAWTDNSSTEDGFKIEQSADNVTFTQIATVGANVTTYSNSGLSASTTYYYRVRATSTLSGDSDYSNTAQATTAALLIASSSETAFLIERSSDNVTFSQIASVGTNVTAFADTGLIASTTYYHRVRAQNSFGTSAYSNTVSATTALALSNLSLSPTTVIGGSTSTGTVTLSGPAPTGGATVTLSSSNTAAATVPASVLVAAGAKTATFMVSTKVVSKPTNVTISATQNGVTKTASLTVK